MLTRLEVQVAKDGGELPRRPTRSQSATAETARTAATPTDSNEPAAGEADEVGPPIDHQCVFIVAQPLQYVCAFHSLLVLSEHLACAPCML